MPNYGVIVIGGGQAGLATAHVAAARGLRSLVLDAAPKPGGSWPHYYDSLTLFSPARFSSLPGRSFPGDPDRYPARDEVVDYLTDYAAHLDTAVEFGQRVSEVAAARGRFAVSTDAGRTIEAPAVVAASGGFGRRGHRPAVSERTVERRFRAATGLTRGAVRQIERARAAAHLLAAGDPAADVVATLGYFDEPHLARALRTYVGRTARQLRDGAGRAIALEQGQRRTS